MNIEIWLNNIIKKLKEQFSDKLLFVGLQGSYNRGEADDESDIDIVVILDELGFEELKIYRSIINSMPLKNKACGFISGKSELKKWSKPDLFQFFYDTKPLYKNLSDITEPPKKGDIKISVKISSENLYHASVHSFMHSNDYKEDLKNLYKTTFFILQSKYFIETGKYIPTKKQLLEFLEGEDKEILNICINKKDIASMKPENIDNLYSKLIRWSSSNI